MKRLIGVLVLAFACSAQAGNNWCARGTLMLPQYQGERSSGVFISPRAEVGPLRIVVMPFYAEHTMKFNEAVLEIVVPSPGTAWYCIYDRHKNLEAEAIFPTMPDVPGDNDVVATLSPSPFILNEGQHYLASSADNSVAEGANYLFATDAMKIMGWTDIGFIEGGHCPQQLQGRNSGYPQSTPWIVLR